MSSAVGNWVIGGGVVGILAGMCILPAAAMDHADANLLSLGATAFSLGALLTAGGLYLKARMLEAGITSRPEPVSVKKVKNGCDLCHGDVPVIQCRVHQLHLCANCLGEHYDYRSCAYTPSTRRATGKGIAKAHGA